MAAAARLNRYVSPKMERQLAANRVFFLDHYFRLLVSRQRRLDSLAELKQSLADKSEDEQSQALSAFYADESRKLRERRVRLHFDENDFYVLSKLGQGGYGEVFLCQRNDANRTLCAVKKMSKRALERKRALSGVLAERDVLVSARSPWLTSLLCSFQDAESLYLCMEFVPGGDLRALLERAGRLTEGNARFFTAEAVAAISTLHALGFIHRDVKPENFLVDCEGHLKLTDFGLSKGELSSDWVEARVRKLERVARDEPVQISNSVDRRTLFRNNLRNPVMGYSLVGTPDYMAPEVIDNSGYDAGVDFWSIGCLVYEMFAQSTPFPRNTMEEMFCAILAHDTTLERPTEEEFAIPDGAWSFIKALITAAPKRFRTIEEVRAHSWFNGWPWDMMRDMPAPFPRAIAHPADISHFDACESFGPNEGEEEEGANCAPIGRVVGFSYRRFDSYGRVWG